MNVVHVYTIMKNKILFLGKIQLVLHPEIQEKYYNEFYIFKTIKLPTKWFYRYFSLS
jgi:hypothetical protein